MGDVMASDRIPAVTGDVEMEPGKDGVSASNIENAAGVHHGTAAVTSVPQVPIPLDVDMELGNDEVPASHSENAAGVLDGTAAVSSVSQVPIPLFNVIPPSPEKDSDSNGQPRLSPDGPNVDAQPVLLPGIIRRPRSRSRTPQAIKDAPPLRRSQRSRSNTPRV